MITIDGIVGARPNMMKMAPLARALARDGTFRLRLIHTGQHYDSQMSDVFFQELGLPVPAFNLEVGSGSQGAQTAWVIEKYESILASEAKPTGVIVVGDVTSTMACALAASKMAVPVAHVEAGLRSGDRTMPEEINRIVTDSISDVLLVSDPAGLVHLSREGHPADTIHLVGNVMIDTLHRELPSAKTSNVIERLRVPNQKYIYATLHRPSNVDDPVILRNLVGVFATLAQELPLVLALHPRTKQRLADAQINLPTDINFIVTPPLGYRDNLRMVQCAALVMTDSGGIQEETSVLNVPCMTLRWNTERPVTVELGTSELVGNDPDKILEAWHRFRAGQWKQANPIPLWDGRAAERIVVKLRNAWA